MPEILEVFTVQRRLFQPEAYPWSYLSMESTRQQMQARYNFAQANILTDPIQNQPQILASFGEFKDAKGSRPIQQLNIGVNSIEFQVTGTSEIADAFFEDLTRFIDEVCIGKKLDRKSEYAKTYQTIAIAKLSFPFTALFSQTFNNVLANSVPQLLSRKDADVKTRLQRLTWIVSYEPKETSIQFLPREFRIEPREGSRPEDNLFYTQSPSDFKTHLQILEALEKTLSPT